MEERFGHDFSQVRLHTGTKSDESAAAVGARAYTVGPDIVFRAGEYAPNRASGRRLLAHELTHVVQQRQSTSLQPTVQRQAGGSRRRRRGLELRQSERPCACLVFVHNNEANARVAVEELHQKCRYNLAIMTPASGGRRVPAVGVTRADTRVRAVGGRRRRFAEGIEVKPSDGGFTVDPNELFSPAVQARCTRNENSCREYVAQNDDFTAQQMEAFLKIKDCTNDFSLPTVALHNNTIGDTRRFLRNTSAAERRRLRGGFVRSDVSPQEGDEQRAELRQRLGRRGRIMEAERTTNVFRWCNLPEIGRCYVGNPDRPDDVVWVTTLADFNRLRGRDINVVLQEATAQTGGNESVTDLSTMFLNPKLGPRARYINIETPGSPRDQQTRDQNMRAIRAVLGRLEPNLLDCCEAAEDTQSD